MSQSWDPIDCRHRGHERIVGVYLAETEDGVAIVDTGPASTLPALEDGLAARGVELGDISHILLTHIHLDHAGAAGTIVRRFPHIQVHVSEVGAPHVIDPSRLERSARQLYLDEFDSLWGELAPVPAENVHVVGSRVLGLDCFPTPGHAKHHVCYLDSAGTLYAGDAAGVRIHTARHIVPPTPPPDIDIETWHQSIDEIERRAPERLALVHFGVKTDVVDHLARLRSRLDLFAGRVRDGLTEEEFTALDLAELVESGGEAARQLYERAIAPGDCYKGLRRYWDKRLEREAAEAAEAATIGGSGGSGSSR
jgi:glyoxylase-like metal-dependent hydrolase (beta-lactamase superfamily II)